MSEEHSLPAYFLFSLCLVFRKHSLCTISSVIEKGSTCMQKNVTLSPRPIRINTTKTTPFLNAKY